MTYETLYLIMNAGVAPAWFLLLILPNHTLTKRLVHSGVYPLLYGLLYGVLLGRAMFFGVSSPDAGMSTLPAMMAIFDHPNGALTGWAHYLVFDLFVGCWIARDAARLGIKHLLIVPCLLFSFMFGPVGLMLYVLVRWFTEKRRFTLNEDG